MPPPDQTSTSGAEGSLSLGALAVANFLYKCMTGYDEPLKELRALAGGVPDVGDPLHRLALLKWLNQWGCQHLAKDHHWLASEGLCQWWETMGGKLPDVDTRLVHPGDADLGQFATVFDALSSICAAKGNRGEREILVSFGPTAAAKTLFILRPHFFVAWDAPVRGRLGLGRSGESYVRFLKDARNRLQQTQRCCERLGASLDGLPGKLGRPGSTAAELINAYYWITLARGVSLPDRTTLEQWLEWSADC
jgi:hypothetical protein